MTARLAAVLLMSSVLPPAPAQERAEAQLPPRALIDGSPGLYTRSHVVFFEAPDLPHDLEAVWMFPARARIQLSAVGAGWSARQLEYRAGDAYYFVESNSEHSEQLDGARRRELQLRLELRRALMLWPKGRTWSRGDEVSTSLVPDAGSFETRLDESGRPSSMRALDSDGAELEGYSAIEWKRRDDRWWPRAMEFSYRGTRVWREEVLKVHATPIFLDWFFVPADRRALEPQPEHLPDKVHTTDLPPAIVRRIELPRDLEWEALLERAADLVAVAREELAPQELQVQDAVSFLISADGLTHCELRLATLAEPPPPGWQLLPERPGLTVYGRGPPSGIERVLARLRSLVPTDAVEGQPYLRTTPAAGSAGALQYVLPLTY